MAGTIKIDPEDLAQKLATVRGIKEAVDAAGKALFDHTQIPDPYDGQLRAKIVPIGEEALGLAKGRVDRLEEMVERVERVIQAFKDADQEVWARCDAGRDVAAYYALLGRELPPPPDWLENGSLPPWLTEGLSPEEQQALLARAREYWAYLLARDANGEPTDPAVLHETLKVLLLASMGVSIDGMVSEAHTLAYDYGRGRSGMWLEYAKDESEADDPVQFLKALQLTGVRPRSLRANSNLCGELAVMAALGLDLDEGLSIFKDVAGYEPVLDEQGKIVLDADGHQVWESMSGTEILLRDRTASGYTLDRFIEKATEGRLTATFTSGHKASDLSTSLDQGKAVIALVNIDQTQAGHLAPASESTHPTSHWVTVLDVVEAPSGPSLVRVYNPYMNRVEVYSMETFEAAWEETPGNLASNSLVIAGPTDQAPVLNQ